MFECSGLVPYGSWAGSCNNEVACSVPVCVSLYRWVQTRESVPQYGPCPPRAFYFCVRLYSANPQGLHTVYWCSPPGALYFCVLQYGASPNGRCTSPKSYVRRESRKALYSVRQGLCFCVLYEPQELCAVRAYKGFVLLCTVRAPRALCGASPQRLYTVYARAGAAVYCTSPKSFVRCEPTKALYS